MEEIEMDMDFKEEIKDNKNISDDIHLSKLFLKCYDFLEINGLDNSNFKEIYEKLRKEFINYGQGHDYGDWAIEYRIKKIVNQNRLNILKFIGEIKNMVSL
jgi:hypothetical protein